MQTNLRRLLKIFLSVLILAILFSGTIKTHKVGKITYCTHGEIIKDDTKTAIAFSLEPLTNEIVRLSDICPKHKKFDVLYEKALAAFSKGDVVNRANYIKKLKRMDAKFSPKSLLSKAEQALQSQPAPTLSPLNVTPQPTNPKPKPFNGENLSVYLPSSIPGYIRLTTDLNYGFAMRNFSARDQTRITYLIVSVRKYPNPQKATAFVKKVHNVLYSKHTKAIKFRGTTAYFGTNDSSYTSLVWSSGKFSYEILIVVSGKASLSYFKDSIGVATRFPGKELM